MASKEEMIKEIITINYWMTHNFGKKILQDKGWSELRGIVRELRKNLKKLEAEYGEQRRS